MSPEPFDPDQTLRALSTGQRVLGQRYTLLRVVGRGGMGVVWLARDETLNDEVALKFLPEAVLHDASAIHDLKHETQRSLKLTHPNIVRIHGFLEDGERAAISMEYVDGATLAKKRVEQPGAILPPELILPYLRQITEALEYAHNRAKIVHRDIKPANILISNDGEVKIADFGISATLTDTATRLSRRDSGSSGSPPYMSPQQMMGEKPSIADDIYALGATVYELITGKPPFHMGNLLMQVQSKIPPSLQERRAELLGAAADGLPPIPEHWEKTIAACLAKEPAHRPASVRRMLDGLENRTPSAAPPPPLSPPLPRPPVQPTPATAIPPAPPKPPAKRRAWLWPVIALLVLALGAAAFLYFRPGGDAPSPTVPLAQKHADPWLAPTPTPAPAPSPAPAATPVPEPVPAKPTPAAPAASAAFIVTVDPVLPDTRLWLGPQADVAVTDGRAKLRNLPPGEQELTVHAPGHQPYITRVTVDFTGGGEAQVKLVPIRGTVTLSARPGTVVTARDASGRERLLGTVDPDGNLNSENVLNVGTYSFRFEHPAFTAVETPGELLAGQPLKLHAEQAPLPGELRIFTSPSGASVTLNGQPAGQTPATLRDQPSETPLIIGLRLRGYRSVEQSITLKPKEIRTLNVPSFTRETGSLRLQITPAAATVDLAYTVDGKAITADAGELHDLEIGKHTVVATHPDYQSWSAEVELKDGEVTPVLVTLAPKPGTLALTTSPAGATVRITGGNLKNSPLKDAGGQDSPTPCKATLPPGDYTLAFNLAGHQAAERKITVAANRELPLRVTLTPNPRPGALAFLITPIEAVSGVTYLIDGKAATPEASELRNLTAGRHTITASHPDYNPWTGEADVKEAETTNVLVTLLPKSGRLTFITTPAGVSVRAVGGGLKTTTWKDADGRETLTPFTGTLPPGAYNLTLSLTGYQTVERWVTVTANSEQTVRVDLGSPLTKPLVNLLSPPTVTAPPKAASTKGVLRLWVTPASSGLLYAIDGKPVTPVNGEIGDITPGFRQLVVSHPDYDIWTRVVSVKGGETTNVQVTLSSKSSDTTEDLIRNRRRNAR
ncbi:MAG: hypothetical protein RIQ79_1492 [Verrucomicrobiota bacterium]